MRSSDQTRLKRVWKSKTLIWIIFYHLLLMLILPSLSPFKTEPWHLILTFRQEKNVHFFSQRFSLWIFLINIYTFTSCLVCIPVWVLHLSLMLIYFKLMCGSFLKPFPCLLNAFFVFSVSERSTNSSHARSCLQIPGKMILSENLTNLNQLWILTFLGLITSCVYAQ